MNAGNGKAEQWLISFTTQLRKQLPAGQYIITHARKSTFSSQCIGSELREICIAVAPW